MRYTLKSYSTIFLLTLLSFKSFAVTLNVVDADIKRGSISDQGLSVLAKLEQGGDVDSGHDWNAYLEATPDKKRFNSKFWFDASRAGGKDWSKITVKMNIVGEAASQQLWTVDLWDFSRGSWENIGDNRGAKPWVWYKKNYEVNNKVSRFIGKNGKIELRYRSNNAKDVSNIDFLQIELASGNSSAEPTPTPNPKGMRDISLQSQITKVQPMTGIVLWESEHNGKNYKTQDDIIQLEYAYLKPSDIVEDKGQYNWQPVENLLERIRKRHKQAIIRFFYAYCKESTTAVPAYIDDSYDDYNETKGKCEKKSTAFPDWSHPELKQAHKDFYTAFAKRYDNDPRLAFLQIGFGLWGEYHIYQPGEKLGKNFPDKAYQQEFIKHLAKQFKSLKWSVSIDAGDSGHSAFPKNKSLLGLNFGNFDDSFMHKEHSKDNAWKWKVFGFAERYAHSPHGGELSYYDNYDQKNALNRAGMYDRTYEELSRQYHITYMIGNDQPNHRTSDRIKEAGMANGYKFTVTSFKASSSAARVKVKNTGIAPIYYDAYVTVEGVRSKSSLKGLLPGEEQEFAVAAGGRNPRLTIECDRLVDGQEIQYNADL